MWLTFMTGEGYTTEFDDRPLHGLTTPDVLATRAGAIGEKTFAAYGPTDERISFAEMWDEARSIAAGLVELGVDELEHVSFFGSHSLYTVYSLYGIHTARAVFAPINYEYEGAELAYQVNDLSPRYLILEDRYADRFNAIVDDLEDLPHIVLVETDAESEPLSEEFEVTPFSTLRDHPPERPDRTPSWDDPAVVLYTSGTTGDPKGVVCAHRVLLANHALLQATLCEQGDTAHNPLPLYHIGGLSFCNSMLLCGGTVALWDGFSASEFWDRVDRYDATVALLLSVMTDFLVDQPERPADRENSLKLVSLQPMPDDCLEIAERFSWELLVVGYGQTETGSPIFGLIDASAGNDGIPEGYRYGTDSGTMKERASRLGIPVEPELRGDRWMGKPIAPNATVTILDEDDEQLPPGSTGQLAIRPNRPSIIMDGYLNRPERTLEAVENLWFHTGDVARLDEDGHYYFVDRMANVIRRRGENISPSQIQGGATRHDAIGAAVAFPVPAEKGGEDEIAVVVQPEPDADLDEATVRDHLEAELPEFMRPKYVGIRDELPTTSTNKVAVSTVRDEFMAGHADFD